MKKFNIVRFFISILLLLLSFQSLGFWIFIETVHQDITATAATNYSYSPYSQEYQKFYPNSKCATSSNNKCSFTDRVIQILQIENKAIDGGSLLKKDSQVVDKDGVFNIVTTHSNPHFHCDDEDIQECSNIIRNGRKQVVKRIISVADNLKMVDEGLIILDDATMPIIEAHTILGNITHTLQDFYSHSNWVERQIYRNVNTLQTFYDYSAEENVRNIDPYHDIIEDNLEYKKNPKIITCETTITDTTLYLPPLTTGYYEERPDIYGFDPFNFIHSANDTQGYKADTISTNGPYYTNWNYKFSYLILDADYKYSGTKPTNLVEKCQHGGLLNATGYNKDGSHFGISKDSSVKRNHLTAKSIATIATTDLIEAIINDVKEQGLNENIKNKYIDAAVINFLENKTTTSFPPPTKVSVIAKNSEATLTWDPVDFSLTPIAYNLYYSTTPDLSRVTATKLSNVSSPYTLTGLTNGVTYYLAITAENTLPKESAVIRESILSTEVSAMPIDDIKNEGCIYKDTDQYIGYEFTGHILHIAVDPNSIPTEGIFINQKFKGQFILDKTAIGHSYSYSYSDDYGDDPTAVDYYNREPSGIKIDIGEYSLESTNGVGSVVGNDDHFSYSCLPFILANFSCSYDDDNIRYDNFSFSSREIIDTKSETKVFTISLDFADSSHKAINDLSQPLLINLSDWEISLLTLEIRRGTPTTYYINEIFGVIDTINRCH